MREKRIINTLVLVCAIFAIIAGVIESGDTDEFLSGLLIGEFSAMAFVMWLLDL